LNGALSAAAYNGLFRQWIQSLKYSGEKDLVKPMALVMARVWADQANTLAERWKVPLRPAPWLTPVPLHPLKFADRGFNQSLLLAQALSEHLGYPVKELLIRKNQESNQADLTADRRRINVRNAFAPAPEWAGRALPGDRLILVVDDIVTTGETLKACAAALKGGGAAYAGGYAWAGGFRKDPLPGSRDS
jgi:predicted amidophosphoribosyltransferase